MRIAISQSQAHLGRAIAVEVLGVGSDLAHGVEAIAGQVEVLGLSERIAARNITRRVHLVCSAHL